MKFDREELLSNLTDAAPALAKTDVLPELTHLWFDGSTACAFDGGLGVRVDLKTDLECGVPGKTLLDLLRTSALKEVELTMSKGGTDLLLTMGKSKVVLATLDLDRCPWQFPDPTDKKFSPVSELKLTPEVLASFTQVSFVRAGKASQVVQNGVTLIPKKKAAEFYATDGATIARTTLNEATGVEAPFVSPWGFVDRFLELVEPDTTLFVMDDCLVVEGKGVLICSNLLELPEELYLSKHFDRVVGDAGEVYADMPSGMQVLLDRASILSGAEEPLVTFDVNGKTLGFLADYPQGAVDEEMELKVSMDKAEAIFPAPLIRRALGQTKTFALSPSGLVMAGGDEFTYILAPHTKAEKKTKKVTKKPADEEDGEKKTTRRKPREQEEDPPEEAEKPTRRGRSEPKEEGEEEPRRRPSRDKDEPAEERPRRRSRRDDDEIPF